MPPPPFTTRRARRFFVVYVLSARFENSEERERRRERERGLQERAGRSTTRSRARGWWSGGRERETEEPEGVCVGIDSGIGRDRRGHVDRVCRASRRPYTPSSVFVHEAAYLLACSPLRARNTGVRPHSFYCCTYDAHDVETARHEHAVQRRELVLVVCRGGPFRGDRGIIRVGGSNRGRGGLEQRLRDSVRGSHSNSESGTMDQPFVLTLTYEEKTNKGGAPELRVRVEQRGRENCSTNSSP